MALIVGAVVIGGLVVFIANWAHANRLRTDAEHFVTLARGAENYVDAHRDQMINTASAAETSPTNNQIVMFGPVNGQTLQQQGYISSNVALTVGAGQTISLMSRARYSSVSHNWIPEAILVTQGGQRYKDEDLAQIVVMAGAIAGSMRTSDTAIRGANGAWVITDPGSWGLTAANLNGHLVALASSGFGSNAVNAAIGADRWLSRSSTPGQPQENQMRTDIDMSGFGLKNASSVTTDVLQANSNRPLMISTSPGKAMRLSSPASTIGLSAGFLDLNASQQLSANVQDAIVAAQGDVAIHGSSISTLSDKAYLITNSSTVLASTGSMLVTGAKGIRIGSVDDTVGGDISIRMPPGDHFTYSDQWGTSFDLSAYEGMKFSGSAFNLQLRTNPDGVWRDIIHIDDKQNNHDDVYIGDGVAPTDLWLRKGSVHSTSDIRLKTALKPMSGTLAKLEKLHGYHFTWKSDGKRDIGVIAQEVQKQFPELVAKGSNGYLGVAYDRLVAPLIEAVRELHQMLLQLQQQLARLFAAQHAQQTEIDQLKAQLVQQRRELVQLKHALHQPLSAGEHALCGAACSQ